MMPPVTAIDADNVLVVARATEDRELDLCGRLLEVSEPHTVVAVTTRDPPRPWLTAHLEGTAVSPAEVELICVGEQCRPDDTAAVPTATVTDPANLTELGSLLSEHLVADTAEDRILCLDSLTTLFEHSGTTTVFQFLHVLTNLVSTNAIQAHYHLDPSSVEDKAVASVKLLVDAVLTVSADGVDVKTR